MGQQNWMFPYWSNLKYTHSILLGYINRMFGVCRCLHYLLTATRMYAILSPLRLPDGRGSPSLLPILPTHSRSRSRSRSRFYPPPTHCHTLIDHLIYFIQ